MKAEKTISTCLAQRLRCIARGHDANRSRESTLTGKEICSPGQLRRDTHSHPAGCQSQHHRYG